MASWISAWYPQHGDTITAQLGCADNLLLACGVFEIDEIELENPPRYGGHQGLVCRGKALGTHAQWRRLRKNHAASYCPRRGPLQQDGAGG